MAESKKTQITSKEVREARAFLRKRNLHTRDISPRDFATTAKKINKTFSETLRVVAKLSMAGQGDSQFEQTKEAIRGTKK